MNTTAPLVSFAGPVKTVPGPGRDGVTLLGVLERESAPAQLSLIGTSASELPGEFADLVIAALSPTRLSLRAEGREWQIECRTWQLHRDVGHPFYAAVPPRPTPWRRKLTWRLLLGVAATAPGRWLLTRRR